MNIASNINIENKFVVNPLQIMGEANEVVRKSMDAAGAAGGWVKENTAMLIIHGIGNQNPLETLDDFARGLVAAYENKLKGHKLTITHEIAVKPGDKGRKWFDNFIRLSSDVSEFHIDIYEYYWANLTQNKISFAGIQRWITSVVREAKSFYTENVRMTMSTRRTDFFKKVSTDPVTGMATYKFRSWRYSWFLRLVGLLLPFTKFVSGLLRWATKKGIPVVGNIAHSIYCSFVENISLNFANVIGDIAIYNTADVKSELYEVRKNILAGAVDAVRFLIEPVEPTKERAYGKVVIVGHSLGTQIGYDAINRIDHLINLDQIAGIDRNGHLLSNGATTGKRVDELIVGFVTFGSPLDKIAFFLREHVDPQRTLMLQIVNNYHSFRQRDWYGLLGPKAPKLQVPITLQKLFEEIKWRNYFDRRDYVSGSLDFYERVENIDCDFKTNAVPMTIKGKENLKKSTAFSFTHGWYWNHEPMFKDIIEQFL